MSRLVQNYLDTMFVCCMYPALRGYGHHVMTEVHEDVYAVPVPDAVVPVRSKWAIGE